MEKDRIFKAVRCDCSSEVVAVQVFDDPSDTYAYLAVFFRSFRRPMGFRERIRWAWKMLSSGEVYGDEVCLTSASAEELSRILSEASDVLKEREIAAKLEADKGD